MENGGHWDGEPTHRAAPGCNLTPSDRTMLRELMARVAAQSVSQQDLARQQFAHTVRSSHTAQLVILCFASGVLNVAIAAHLLVSRILDALASIGGARISLLVLGSVLLLGVGGVGCAVLGLKQPPLTTDGLQRFARWRFWALLTSIAMTGVAICIYKK